MSQFLETMTTGKRPTIITSGVHPTENQKQQDAICYMKQKVG
jgi:hypothetical protein